MRLPERAARGSLPAARVALVPQAPRVQPRPDDRRRRRVAALAPARDRAARHRRGRRVRFADAAVGRNRSAAPWSTRISGRSARTWAGAATTGMSCATSRGASPAGGRPSTATGCGTSLTAWGGSTIDEHRLLSSVLFALADEQAIPAEHVTGDLVERRVSRCSSPSRCRAKATSRRPPTCGARSASLHVRRSISSWWLRCRGRRRCTAAAPVRERRITVAAPDGGARAGADRDRRRAPPAGADAGGHPGRGRLRRRSTHGPAPRLTVRVSCRA